MTYDCTSARFLTDDLGSAKRGATIMNIMTVQTHAPSQPVLVVGVLVALLAIIHFFIPGSNHNISFWLMTLAYVVAALGTVAKM